MTSSASADAGPPRIRLDRLRLRAMAGAAPPEVAGLPPRARRALRVAVVTGSPLVPALDAVEAALRDGDDRRRAVSVATAQSRTVAAGLLVIPVVMLPVLSGVLGLDVVAFYAGRTGLAVAGVSAVLGTLGGAWTRWLLRRVEGTARTGPGRTAGDIADDEVVDLTATAVAGGLGAAAALRLVAEECPDLAGPLRSLALRIDLDRLPEGAPTGPARLAPLLVEARDLGAPVVPALRDLAGRLRADAHADALAAAARLPAHLTFPAVLCLLPAGLLLVGAPLVASGLDAAGL